MERKHSWSTKYQPICHNFAKKYKRLVSQFTVDIAKLSHLLSSFQISVYNLETKIGKVVCFFFLV